VAYKNHNFDIPPIFSPKKSGTYWEDSRQKANDKVSFWWNAIISNTCTMERKYP
jgi:hypothetical protein